MARSNRRKTFWEGTRVSLSLTDTAIVGGELIDQAVVDDFAPATLVRTRISIFATDTTTPDNTNLPIGIHVAVRKVTLSRTTGTYAEPSGSLDDSAYLSAEDILYFGTLIYTVPRVLTFNSTGTLVSVFQRGLGKLDIDIKAKRIFGSAEERLVIEAQLVAGGTTGTNIVLRGGSRMLFMAG